MLLNWGTRFGALGWLLSISVRSTWSQSLLSALIWLIVSSTDNPSMISLPCISKYRYFLRYISNIFYYSTNQATNHCCSLSFRTTQTGMESSDKFFISLIIDLRSIILTINANGSTLKHVDKHHQIVIKNSIRKNFNEINFNGYLPCFAF